MLYSLIDFCYLNCQLYTGMSLAELQNTVQKSFTTWIILYFFYHSLSLPEKSYTLKQPSTPWTVLYSAIVFICLTCAVLYNNLPPSELCTLYTNLSLNCVVFYNCRSVVIYKSPSLELQANGQTEKMVISWLYSPMNVYIFLNSEWK